MDNEILHCSNDDIDFALPFNKNFDEFINELTTLSEIGNIDVFESGNFEYQSNFASKNVEDNVVESGEFEYQSNFISVIGNIEDNMFENSDLEYQFNLAPGIENIENDVFESDNLEYWSSFTPIIKNVGDNIYESDSEDKLEDSPLKEIYTRQTFLTFKSLEKCLKHYSTKMDPTTNKECESACIECDFVLNASYRKLPNCVFVNKLVEKHNYTLKDSNLLQECNLGATALKRILRNRFSDQEIYNRDLYNMISRFKADTQTKNDALTLYESLDGFISDFYTLRNSIAVSDFDSHWADLMNKYPEVQEANSGNSLCQLQTGIELRLKDEAKYARLQEFRNMNPTAGFSNVSNTIFKEIDYISLEDCHGIGVKKTWKVKHIQSTTNHSQFVLLLKDALFNMKLIPLRWFSEEGLVVFDKNQELSVQVVQNDEPIPTSTFQILERIHGQEINVRNAIKLDSKKVSYENILQRFIEEQASVQNKNVSEPELNQDGSFKISNPSQHKGRGRPANKRYLSAIENHNSNNVSSNNQNEDSESRPKKKNKCQCAVYKS
ncbi:1803_t:CDS:2 [Dentiscutata heterogama]|uniref:1803_t:CDS:1 n=1 Tax=Dentiscutata heterogama TaxID=1316150 RepID=A0ACA9KMJ0_9GLOM|nr:1803_t:CDS:2 [Dentiscutata heterogama]